MSEHRTSNSVAAEKFSYFASELGTAARVLAEAQTNIEGTRAQLRQFLASRIGLTLLLTGSATQVGTLTPQGWRFRATGIEEDPDRIGTPIPAGEYTIQGVYPDTVDLQHADDEGRMLRAKLEDIRPAAPDELSR